MRLSSRLIAIGLLSLAGTVLLSAVITFQIVRVTGRQNLDQVLRDEAQTVAATLPALLDDGAPTTVDSLTRAATEYLALHPGTSRHLTVLTLGDVSYTTRRGPTELVRLERSGRLPTGNSGTISSVDTEAGPVRVLNTPLRIDGAAIGTAIVAGPLGDVDETATRVLTGIVIGGAVGLLLGGGALALSTRRAIRPVVDLAAAARGTATNAGPKHSRSHVPVAGRRDEVSELATEFNAMLDRIEAEAEHRRRLLSAVSHELRTPLAVARGHLELFEEIDLRRTAADDIGDKSEDPADDTALADLVDLLRGELDRLTRVAGDLEAVLHGDAETTIVLEPVFVPDAFDDLAQRVLGLGLTEVRFGRPPPVVVEADPDRLAQALLNLVRNARSHTPPDTVVTVEGRVVSNDVVVDVIDDGPGIDPAIREHIFEPFVTTRADGSSRGRGLGLAIVKSLVEAQRGSVRIESGPTGTTVSVRLPLAPTTDEPD